MGLNRLHFCPTPDNVLLSLQSVNLSTTKTIQLRAIFVVLNFQIPRLLSSDSPFIMEDGPLKQGYVHQCIIYLKSAKSLCLIIIISLAFELLTRAFSNYSMLRHNSILEWNL